jgi:hypothetical protein
MSVSAAKLSQQKRPPFRDRDRARELTSRQQTDGRKQECIGGSLACGAWFAELAASRCIRENCPACLSGEQHQSYVLYDRANGRRVAVYVPEELVPEVQRSLDNGRALQDLLHQAAPRYIKALKRERTGAPRSDEG